MFADVVDIISTARRERLDQLRQQQENEEETQEENTDQQILLSYEKLLALHGEAAIFQFTGFNHVEFLEIYHKVENALDIKKRGKRPKMEPKDMLLVTLTYMQTGMRYKELAHIFNIRLPLLERCLYFTIRSIAPFLKEAFIAEKPTSHHSAIRFPNHPHALGAVDVALIETVRPKYEQKLFYSVKHHSHGVKLQACVSPDGICIDMCFGWPGSIHDKRCWDESNLLQRLTYQYENPDGSQAIRHYACLFDRGYTGVKSAQYREALVTLKKPIRGELTPQQLEFNRNVESDRVIVENFFMRLRQRFGILQKKFRGDRINLLPPVVTIAVALTNYYNTKHPMRNRNNNEE